MTYIGTSFSSTARTMSSRHLDTNDSWLLHHHFYSRSQHPLGITSHTLTDITPLTLTKSCVATKTRFVAPHIKARMSYQHCMLSAGLMNPHNNCFHLLECSLETAHPMSSTKAQIYSRLSQLPANWQRAPRAIILSIEAILLRLASMEVETEVFRPCSSFLFKTYTRSSCPYRSGDTFSPQERTHVHKLSGRLIYKRSPS